MPEYVDGYVLPLPRKNLPTYRRLARFCAKLWREHGALAFRECVADDLRTPFGPMFPRRLKLQRGETVMFSWIVFKSRTHRDRVNARVMKDPRMAKMMARGPMPFNPRRILYGGFKVIVRA